MDIEVEEQAFKWLDGNRLSYDIWNNKYRYNNESFDKWLDRVSGGNKEIRRLIFEKKFLFGGRTLTNRGIKDGGSYSNCYSYGYVEDSLSKIMQCAKDIAMTFKAQGGQGISLSKIRPKGALIGGKFPSDGIVPFMNVFNTVTESVSQGGCIAKDELVLTNNGLIPIKDIQVGDLVWTKNRYIKVDYKWNKGKQNIYKVTLKSGATIKTTLDHKFNIDGFNGKPLKDLKVGDKVVYIKGDNQSNNIFNEAAYILAAFLANGFINQEETEGNITFAKNIPTGKIIVAKYLHKLTEQQPYIYECSGHYKVTLSKSAINILGYNKKGTKSINIPDEILHSPNNIRLSFIAGLLDTGGYVYGNAFKYNTNSLEFADQLVILLNSVGYFPKKFIQHRNGQPLYEVYCSVHSKCPSIPSYKYENNIKNVVKNSKSITPFTIENLKIINRTGHLKKLSKTNNIGLYTYLKECSEYYVPCILEEIVSIESYGEDIVYDISLESEHFFSCNGFYVSNSRKGALLMSLDINHPEAETFITIKEDLNKINKANLSVEIDDDFMLSLNTNEHNKKLFRLLAKSAWKSAEPGVLFTNSLRNYNLMEFVEEYQIETTNPCGEQPLGKHMACNLCSINLAAYIKSPYKVPYNSHNSTDTKFYSNFDLITLCNDVKSIVREMDIVLEENISRHALPEQREMAAKYRNIGIGIMGLADLVASYGLKYGCKESVDFAGRIIREIFRTALKESVEIAKEKGNFPGYNSKIWDSEIIKNAFTKEEIEEFKKTDCLRNCSLISIAPTGSIGTMFNVSTGCEPFFALSYNRRTESMNKQTYKVDIKAVQDYREATKNYGELPEFFITAKDISWKERIDMQAALQEFTDAAISSTINLPKETTIEDVEELYKYAWKKGLKGITIYREGSRDPILFTDKEIKEIDTPKIETTDIKRGDIVNTENCIGLTRTLTTGCGNLHCSAFFNRGTGELREIYLSKGSTGGCQQFMIGLSRMISLSARGGISIDHIIDQLRSSGVCPSYSARSITKKDVSKGSSCPVAISYALKDMYNEIHSILCEFSSKNTIKVKEVIEVESLEECPNCHEKTLIHEGGCISCTSCGFSRCS